MLTRLGELIESEFGIVQTFLPEMPGWVAPWQYRIEMGHDLANVGVALQERLTVEDLVKLKSWTMTIEHDTRITGKRTLNLNPGIVLKELIVVASHKPREGIRRYIGRDCWVQCVATVDCAGRFIPSRHTFSEYAAPSRLELFTRFRAKDLGLELGKDRRRLPSQINEVPFTPLHLPITIDARI